MPSSPAPTTRCRTPRACLPRTWCAAAIRRTLTASLQQLIERKRDLDFPWFPARVVCHDILGQTALVDLAGLRDAIAEQGGDPAQVNPVVPVQLIVDHSLAVECGGFDPDAFAKNRAIEDRRNEDRFHFIDWTKQAFKNVDVIPPGNGIMHQINLEKMSPVVHARGRRRLPGHLRRHRQPHAARRRAGRDRDRRRRAGSGERDARPRVVDAPAGDRRRRADAAGRSPGITATDVVLALTEFLRKSKVVGAYLEFRGEGAAALTLGDRATISNMAPEYGATAAMFFIDEQHPRLPAPDRPRRRAGRAGRNLCEDTPACGPTACRRAQYERTLHVRPVDAWCATWPARRTRTRACRRPTSRRAASPAPWDGSAGHGPMPDGAVIIAAITSCTNTSPTRAT